LEVEGSEVEEERVSFVFQLIVVLLKLKLNRLFPHKSTFPRSDISFVVLQLIGALLVVAGMWKVKVTG
jgi:hypothetical protein